MRPRGQITQVVMNTKVHLKTPRGPARTLQA